MWAEKRDIAGDIVISAEISRLKESMFSQEPIPGRRLLSRFLAAVARP
jgi:hypothetical protein